MNNTQFIQLTSARTEDGDKVLINISQIRSVNTNVIGETVIRVGDDTKFLCKERYKDILNMLSTRCGILTQ